MQKPASFHSVENKWLLGVLPYMRHVKLPVDVSENIVEEEHWKQPKSQDTVRALWQDMTQQNMAVPFMNLEQGRCGGWGDLVVTNPLLEATINGYSEERESLSSVV